MKKKLISILLCLVIQAFAGDESLDKKRIVLKDGRSFQQFEDEFRQQYEGLTIPKIEIIEKSLSLMAYFPKNNSIEVLNKDLFNEDLSSLQWSLLHETGHAQMPSMVQNIDIAALFSVGVTPFLWGKHKAKPYKNIVTKIGSKSLATMMAPILTFCVGRKLEERRADNFANKYADKEALLAEINRLELHKQQELKYLVEGCEKISKTRPVFAKALYIILYPLTFGDPIHPTLNSRIRKIKSALKTRFGVDA